jgi:type IV pilus assembly protein PilZ
VVHLWIPGQRAALAIPGVVRWARDGGMGVQFGLLGARETHAIMSLVQKKT